MCASQSVPKGGVLAVVVVEVEMVNRMASGTIDNRIMSKILTVVDHNCPDVNETEETKVNNLLQREYEREHVIRQALDITVDRVERVRGERCGNNPLVVRLVQILVHPRMMQATVCEIDKGIGEEQEQRKLEQEVSPATVALHRPEQLRVALCLSNKPRNSKQGHDGNGSHGLVDFHANLIFQVFRVLEILVIIDHII